MRTREIKNQIEENKKMIQKKESEIVELKRIIYSLEKKLDEKQEENLIQYIKVGDEFTIKSWIRIGNKLNFRKDDSFKITKVNNKSLYIKILKKHGWISNNSGVILPPENEIYGKEIKISSKVFYNGFYNEIKEFVDKNSNRNEILSEILD